MLFIRNVLIKNSIAETISSINRYNHQIRVINCLFAFWYDLLQHLSHALLPKCVARQPFFYTFVYLQMNHGTLYFSKSKIQKFFEWMQMEDNRVYRSICWRVLVVKKSLQCKHTININLLFPLQLSCFLLSHLYFIDTHNAHLFFVIFMNTILLSYV